LIMLTLLFAVIMIIPREGFSDPTAWFTLVAFGGFGDWGVRTLHLGTLGEWWGKVDYSLFIGAGMLVVGFVQAALTELIMRWAVRRAERLE
jgi:hypothetical protein